MEIYLDANATTPVLPQARAAALAVMADTFGNPSSIHGAGLRARVVVDDARARARRVLGARTGRILFTSGATEGIQTAVLSALTHLKARGIKPGVQARTLLLYGATEHKAVPVALKHWNEVLGLGLQIKAIPVDTNGRHDLKWLAAHAGSAGFICTMAANNETGVVSDLDGIERAIAGSGALWMVDSVQALGKLSLDLNRHSIDYAPFSGHKLYAPKGIGMLYVRDGAPFTPLLTGGGQEEDLRAGTENTTGIAALGAVLRALEEHDLADRDTLMGYRTRLTNALCEAFPGLIFNAPQALSLPTTLNFSVAGVTSKVLLDLFDAAGIRVSGGSACSASKPKASDVLVAMGLPDARAANAVRLSFGAADTPEVIAEACRRIRQCGVALRSSCATGASSLGALPARLITRYVVDGACCYVICPQDTTECVVIDPLPELSETIANLVQCQGRRLVAVLDTHSHGDHASSAGALWARVSQPGTSAAETDVLGWPRHHDTLIFGSYQLKKIATPGHTSDARALALYRGKELVAAFVGDTVMPGALGRSDFPVSVPMDFAKTLRLLDKKVGRDALLLPGHDYEDRHATTLGIERAAQPLVAVALEGTMTDAAFVIAKEQLERDLAPTEYNTMACGARVDRCTAGASVEMSSADVDALLLEQPLTLLVDVRELYEQRVDLESSFAERTAQAMPVSSIINAIPGWLELPPDRPIVFFCRSGNRSAQVARAMRRLGRSNAWSLAGGLALRERGESFERASAASAAA